MTQITKIVLIRHGQTDWNLARRWQGHADIPLNETGEAQAAKLQQRLASWSIDAFVSSDLKRAHKTAVIASSSHQLAVNTNPIWRERDVGDFQGFSKDEVQANFPQVWQNSVNGILEPPNGERYQDLRQRAMDALGTLTSSDLKGTVAVVSHGQLIHVLLAQIMGIDSDQYGRFSMRGNTGISIIELPKGKPIVTRLNDTAHLD